MFLIKDQFCAAGRTVCEDAVAAGKHYLFAMDGASGLTGSCIMDEESDAAWFVRRVKAELCRALDAEDPRSTEEILKDILAPLRVEYESKAKALGHEVPPDSPSAGIALFRERNGEVEFFGLGDCLGAAERTDGTVETFCDTVLPALDGGVIDAMAELHRTTGISVLAARKHCNDQLVRNRALRNTPQGYWILDLSGMGVAHAATCVWRKNELRAISACSDGLTQLVETFGLYPDFKALHRAMTEHPLEQLRAQLFAAQEADPKGNKHPRLKFRDDACGVWAEVVE